MLFYLFYFVQGLWREFHIQGNLTHTVQKYPKGNNNLNRLLWVEKREYNII